MVVPAPICVTAPEPLITPATVCDPLRLKVNVPLSTTEALAPKLPVAPPLPNCKVLVLLTVAVPVKPELSPAKTAVAPLFWTKLPAPLRGAEMVADDRLFKSSVAPVPTTMPVELAPRLAAVEPPNLSVPPETDVVPVKVLAADKVW